MHTCSRVTGVSCKENGSMSSLLDNSFAFLTSLIGVSPGVSCASASTISLISSKSLNTSLGSSFFMSPLLISVSDLLEIVGLVGPRLNFSLDEGEPNAPGTFCPFCNRSGLGILVLDLLSVGMPPPDDTGSVEERRPFRAAPILVFSLGGANPLAV